MCVPSDTVSSRDQSSHAALRPQGAAWKAGGWGQQGFLPWVRDARVRGSEPGKGEQAGVKAEPAGSQTSGLRLLVAPSPAGCRAPPLAALLNSAPGTESSCGGGGPSGKGGWGVGQRDSPRPGTWPLPSYSLDLRPARPVAALITASPQMGKLAKRVQRTHGTKIHGDVSGGLSVSLEGLRWLPLPWHLTRWGSPGSWDRAGGEAACWKPR